MDDWTVLFDDAFETELPSLPEDVQDELLAHAKLLQCFGPQLGRPRVDTLKGSRFPNMKELRFDAANGVWRVDFAFDPERRAILLAAGDKVQTSEKRFYRQLIKRADERFALHLKSLTRSGGSRA
ncbi:type II toxin-antitoxin system RelE/ParE family toxin [Thiocapsa sp.]|uniref:type II toxin-antitoxin system RelE/ParE family toxin n=1 Tax=Thiocapsa sp. TaxID=2024551 RepID=UPI0035945DF1